MKIWNPNIFVFVFVQNFNIRPTLDDKCRIIVKNPVGATDMFNLSRIVLQGSVFGPLKCSVQMDTIGREFLRTGFGIFKYKDAVDIPSLAMIDDILGMNFCGDASIEFFSFLSANKHYQLI